MDAYISGHDHMLMHYDHQDVHYFISGMGEIRNPNKKSGIHGRVLNRPDGRDSRDGPDSECTQVKAFERSTKSTLHVPFTYAR